MSKPKLLFVSPRFLFPIDSGGKIRTTGILREMLGGAFDITLLSPAPPAGENYDQEMKTIADRWHYWPVNTGWSQKFERIRSVFGAVPIPVASDASVAGRQLIAAQLANNMDVVVFDFIHAAILAPDTLPIPGVMFTHNVEAEIFARHAQVASNPLMRLLWRSQWRKMLKFEEISLSIYDKVVTVSERDGEFFEKNYALTTVETIPTGVDLNFFPYRTKPQPGKVVFTGSMDWLANQDGIQFFMDEVWPQIVSDHATASMCVVGRSPPDKLVKRAAVYGSQWQFTGFVDDVREYINEASVYVIPLRVGGGTRLKVFEAMACGSPVVSTALGVEGLELTDGVHYLNAETPEEFAGATTKILNDPELAKKLSLAARTFVVENASNAGVARRFEAICQAALNGSDKGHSGRM